MIDIDQLVERYTERSATVGVIGLGYVGLPLAIAFAESGYRVLGFDTDPDKPVRLLAGDSYIGAVSSRRLRRVAADGKFVATDDLGRLGETDATMICVPTPLDARREPDLSFVENSGRALAATLRPGQLVVLESTTYPGTTREVLLPILAATGLEVDRDFFLAYSPEREDPGNTDYTVSSIPKVVGADHPASRRLALELYRPVVPELVAVSSTAAAEATKLTENIYRAVNIALVNELKMVYAAMGIDVWEVLAAADTKPFGFQRFNPGPGWGGHCIPIDPFYLAWRARREGSSARFVELAGRVNTEMPGWVLDRLGEALAASDRGVKGARILLLGVAYKANVDDARESPAFVLWDRLAAEGAEVAYHDPHIPRLPATRSWPSLHNTASTPLNAETLAGADAVIVLADHDAIDFDLVARYAKLILDTRGVYPVQTPRVVRA